jgi:hypothetical protein
MGAFVSGEFGSPLLPNHAGSVGTAEPRSGLEINSSGTPREYR